MITGKTPDAEQAFYFLPLVLFSTFALVLIRSLVLPAAQASSLTMQTTNALTSQLTISSSTSKLALHPGKTGSYNLLIKNTWSALGLKASMGVTSFPNGGSASAIVLTVASHVTTKAAGTTVVPVRIAVSQSAVQGFTSSPQW
jgi:hypothetical protein